MGKRNDFKNSTLKSLKKYLVFSATYFEFCTRYYHVIRGSESYSKKTSRNTLETFEHS